MLCARLCAFKIGVKGETLTMNNNGGGLTFLGIVGAILVALILFFVF